MLHRDLLPEIMLPAEVGQRNGEGYDLGDLPHRIETAIAAGTIEAQASAFWSELEDVARLPDARDEPSDLEAICAMRPDAPHRYALELSEAALYDHVYGGWLGRCAGCTLGKPVEGWPRAKIETYLRAADAHPLASYFPVLDPFPEGLALSRNYKRTALGNVRGMTRDDDIDYTILGLHILETYGRDFSSRDVATAWMNNLSFYKVYTAEAVAYRHLVNGLEPPQTARRRNPYREWLGSTIRADMWGYVSPGDPQQAAAFAHRDTSISHTSNGIYSAMWAAACVAVASATADPLGIVNAGLAEIPADCRLAEAVRDTVAWFGECAEWEDAWERLEAKYGHYAIIHVIKNTCSIVLGLLYGEGDLEKSICYTVMGGWDTDSTGATVGSIVGTMCGADALPEKWIGPLEDRVDTIVPDFHHSQISDLARRTVALARWPEGESLY